jgi:hypothetical protein
MGETYIEWKATTSRCDCSCRLHRGEVVSDKTRSSKCQLLALSRHSEHGCFVPTADIIYVLGRALMHLRSHVRLLANSGH